MARTAPTSPTAAPTPPIQRGDRATFSNRVDATITYLTGAPAEIFGLATNAYQNALDAFNSATAANTSAGTAGTAATNAATARDLAQGYRDTTLGYRDTTLGYRDAAAISATNAENSRLGADKKYLGAKSAFPTVDNQGAALTVGAWYFDTVLNRARVWNGSNWIDGVTAVAGVSSVNNQVGALTLKTLNGTDLVGAGNIITRTTAPVETRSSNTQITAADQGKWLKLSGTFTQTFATAAALGNGYAIFISNAGTGEITMPDVDGWGSTWKMYPGETRLFVSDGAALRTIIIEPFRQSSSISFTFSKPPGYSFFDVTVVGGGAGGDGGGGGGAGTAAGTGGGGTGGAGGAGGAPGQTARVRFVADILPASVSCLVGAGGAAGTKGTGGVGAAAGSVGGNGGNGGHGTSGGDTTFGNISTPYAYVGASGGAAVATAISLQGGKQGSQTSTPATGSAGPTAALADTTFQMFFTGGMRFPTSAAGNGGNSSTTVASTATYGAATNGGNGGVGAASAVSTITGSVAGAVAPAAAQASVGVPGNNGATPSKGEAGSGGAGGSGGSGSVGIGSTTNNTTPTAKGGDGGFGAPGGDGLIDILGVI